MSERLTKRTENGGVQFSNGEYWNTVYPKNENCLTDIHRMAIKLCDLDDKIEQGKILELPCKVGSEAYHLTSADTLDELGVAEIFNGKVCSFSKDEKGLWIFCRYDNGLTYWYKETDIGAKLFLDRAAAEAKLREMEGERE